MIDLKGIDRQCFFDNQRIVFNIYFLLCIFISINALGVNRIYFKKNANNANFLEEYRI